MGLFVTFEGIEGCGKTTQMEMLKEHLEWKGLKVVATREPGGTELGEKIRNILLSSEEGKTVVPWSELLLYEVCRAQLVHGVIKPALQKNNVVLCDRFADSTVVYQGYVRGLNIDAINSLNTWVTEGIFPAITFLIDCSPEVGLKRAMDRISMKSAGNKEDRFEMEDMEFHKKVREGYLKIAGQAPERIKIVDGERDIAMIHKEICDIINKLA